MLKLFSSVKLAVIVATVIAGRVLPKRCPKRFKVFSPQATDLGCPEMAAPTMPKRTPFGKARPCGFRDARFTGGNRRHRRDQPQEYATDKARSDAQSNSDFHFEGGVERDQRSCCRRVGRHDSHARHNVSNFYPTGPLEPSGGHMPDDAQDRPEASSSLPARGQPSPRDFPNLS